jgi:tetratricopeptide (TPR) repeat protein
VANLAVNGNMAFRDEAYDTALDWYERAFRAGDAPGWAYWNAAAASAMEGRTETAFDYLRQALNAGVGDLESVTSSKYLRSLEDTPGWKALIERLEKRET